MTPTIPHWLKTDPVIIHTPNRTIFEPQRRIIRFNGQPHLLDCCNNRYPLQHCDRLKPEYLNGVALWITEGTPLTVFRLNSAGDIIAITDGVKKAFVQLSPQPSQTLCFSCGKPATKLCDGRGCDRPMCPNCVAHQGVYIACGRGTGSRSGTVDYCRDCAAKRGLSINPAAESSNQMELLKNA